MKGTDKRQKIVETIKKLMVHAQSPACTEEEALAFASKVTALRAEYRVEEHELDQNVVDAMDFRDYGITHVTAYPPGAPGAPAWQAIVFLIVSDANACQAVMIADTGHFFIAGATLDRAIVCALSARLVAHIDFLCNRAWEEARQSDAAVLWGAVREAGYRESYRSGFLQALNDRLTEQRDQIEAGSETALVVLRDAVVKTERYLATQVSGNRRDEEHQFEITHSDAALRGYEDGMKADLGRARIEGTGQARKEIE